MNKLSAAILVFSMVLASCGTSEKSKQELEKTSGYQANEKFFDGNIEPVKTRLDVYNSMARSVKYNVDATTKIMADKLYSTTKPKEVVRDILNIQARNEDNIFGAMKALDFAIIYSTNILSSNKEFLDDNLYVKSSQNLLLAAIKSHQDALFALRKTKEIDRVLSRENKRLKALNDKLERAGMLSDEDLAYKKDLEVSILKMESLKKEFETNIYNHARLIKVEDAGKLDLEGRKFYELEDFDKRLSTDVFQQSAFKHRDEFDIAAEIPKEYQFEDVELIVFQRYPEMERLKINGFGFESPLYVDDLVSRAQKNAYALIDETVKYATAPAGGMDKAEYKQKAFEELGIALFNQIEVAYNMIKVAELEVTRLGAIIADLKKEVSGLEKAHRSSYDEKSKLLAARVQLFEEEYKYSQLLGERALAIRSLYFCAGFSPFSKKFLRSDTKDMVGSLKVGFNKDVVEMLADAQKGLGKHKEEVVATWIKGENWLEDLMEEKPETATANPVSEKKANIASFANTYESYSAAGTLNSSPAVKPSGVFDPYVGVVYNTKKNMQLGSYIKKESADIEWSMLKELYPELAKFTPKTEMTRVDGKIYYRMIISSPDGGFMDLCNKLRTDKVECLLR